MPQFESRQYGSKPGDGPSADGNIALARVDARTLTESAQQ
jgi:hypothetical protein